MYAARSTIVHAGSDDGDEDGSKLVDSEDDPESVVTDAPILRSISKIR